MITLDFVRVTENAVSDGDADGDLAQGVRFFGNRARTHSVVMDSQGTLREIDSVHRLRAVPR